MSLYSFFDGKVNHDDNQIDNETTINSDVEQLEFGYIKEVYRDDMGILHSHIYHEQLEMPADERWEVLEIEIGPAPLELMDPVNEPNDSVGPVET